MATIPKGRAAAGPRSRTRRILLWAAALACASGADLGALTRSDLLGDPDMTPEHFASYFQDFKWDVHPFDIQNPDQFLATRTGDCIDYAVLADYVLKRRGFRTRLIRVEMIGKNMGHAVCYVTERRAYLDYNNRTYFFKLQRSGPSIREVATKVADSFDANWTFAQEFAFEGYKTFGVHALMTVVKTDPADSDPDKGRY
jgi:hypothetical protein